MRNVLMVAYHFPPCAGSSGLLRTLCFSRDLLQLGWRAHVLTVTRNAYEQVSDDLMATIPDGVSVHRALALDTRRHLSFKGRYPDFLGLPDRYITWLVPAVIRGLWLIKRRNIDVVWSTYPVATSHLIAFSVSRLAGRPWIADFRDPMVEFDAIENVWHPQSSSLRRARLYVERASAKYARAMIFCTEAARQIYVERYGDAVAGRTQVIPNGYDEAAFAQLEVEISKTSRTDEAITLVHSGTIYPSPDRDPGAFFTALRRLKERGLLRPGLDCVILRASGSEEWLARSIAERQVSDIVRLEPRCSYQDALREVCSADGLLVFQGYTSNPAVPAKLYEYIRAGRPIFGMVDSDGETAALLREVGVTGIAELNSVDDIELHLERFITAIRAGTLAGVSRESALEYSREHRAQELATLLRRLSEGTSVAR